MSFRLPAVLGLLLPLLMWSSPARAQCGGTQLCAAGAGDCLVNTACTITVPAGGLQIALGARRLVITSTLTVQGADLLEITAGEVLIDGGSIVAPGVGGTGGSVTIDSATSFTVQNNGLMDVSAGVSGGNLDLEALGGDFTFSGRIKANGTTRDGFGGSVTLLGSENTSVAGGMIDVSGGDRGAGGVLDIEAISGSLTVSVPLSGPGGDGGDVVLGGGTSLQTTAAADINVSATGDAGSGGSVDISANGDITVAGAVDGTGAVSADPTFPVGGDGADYGITSIAGSVTVTGQSDVSAAAGGLGGSIDFEAGTDLTVSKSIALSSTGPDGAGGDALFLAAGDLTLSQSANAQGGTGRGGTIQAQAVGDIDIVDQLTVNGTLSAGSISVTGCAVTFESPAVLSSLGPTQSIPDLGKNTIQAGSAMTIAGTLRASQQNLLPVRSPPAPRTTRATIVPPPTIQQDPTIPCCVACPSTTTTSTTTSTTSTSTPTTTTTSSTAAPTTTTVPATTTTSTTIVPSTTTTTVPPPTTTSSTLAPTTTTSTTTTTTTASSTTTSSSSTTTTSTTSTTSTT